MSEPQVTPTEYLSVAQVALTLGLSKQTVYRMCQVGRLRHIRTGETGKIYRIPRDALRDHLNAATPPNDPSPSWAWTHPGQTEIPT